MKRGALTAEPERNMARPVVGLHTDFSHVYLDEVQRVREVAAAQYDLLLTRTQVETMTERIIAGDAWLAANRKHKKYPAAVKLHKELTEHLNRVRYENEVPLIVLDYLVTLLHETTRLNIRIPGASIRVTIPGVLALEADLLYEDVPF